jgi:Domain of unknown function (DUF927)
VSFKCAKPFDAAEGAPAYISFGKFTMDADGLHTELKRGRGDNSEIEIVRVSAPFEILGLGRDPHGRAWGRFLRWRDLDGRPHEKFVVDEALQGDAAAICGPERDPLIGNQDGTFDFTMPKRSMRVTYKANPKPAGGSNPQRSRGGSARLARVH